MDYSVNLLGSDSLSFMSYKQYCLEWVSAQLHVMHYSLCWEVDTGITYTELCFWSESALQLCQLSINAWDAGFHGNSGQVNGCSWHPEHKRCAVFSAGIAFFFTLVVYDDCLKKTKQNKKPNLDLFKEISHYNVEKQNWQKQSTWMRSRLKMSTKFLLNQK